MSWNKTYSHTLALAVDRFGAALLFNQPDITISSLCWLVRTYPATKVLERITLHTWQFALLTGIGAGLERFWPGHCARARDSDRTVSLEVQGILA